MTPEKPKRQRGGIPFGLTPNEAKVVERIREMWAAGVLQSDISARLNEEGVPSPTSREWTATGVKGVLVSDAARRRKSAPPEPVPQPISKRK